MSEPTKTGEVAQTSAPVEKTPDRMVALAPVIGAVLSVMFSGGGAAFLVGYASTVRAEARAEVAAGVSVVAQKADVVKGDVEALKQRVEAVDAGSTKAVENLRNDMNAKFNMVMEARDKDRALLLELVREKRGGR